MTGVSGVSPSRSTNTIPSQNGVESSDSGFQTAHDNPNSSFESNTEGRNPDSLSANDESNHTSGSASGLNNNDRTTAETIAAEPTTAEMLAGVLPSSESAINTASNIGAANVGYNLPMQGANLGPIEVKPMKFGEFARASIKPTAGVTLDTFSRPKIDASGKYDFHADMARQKMVSTQSAYEYAKSVDPTLANTRFEVPSPDLNVRRTYDIEFAGTADDKLVEVKAGKSIDYSQVPKDIDLANTRAQAIEYVHAGNPITGNHGPDSTTLNKLNRMGAQTGGLITNQTADVAVTSRQVDAVLGASTLTRVAKGAGKVLGPAAVVLDVYTIKTAMDKDGGEFGEHTKVAVAETAGGWAGAGAGGYAGAKFGALAGTALGGPVGAAVGAAAGGVIGAIGGAIGGGSIAAKISSWF